MKIEEKEFIDAYLWLCREIPGLRISETKALSRRLVEAPDKGPHGEPMPQRVLTMRTETPRRRFWEVVLESGEVVSQGGITRPRFYL